MTSRIPMAVILELRLSIRLVRASNLLSIRLVRASELAVHPVREGIEFAAG